MFHTVTVSFKQNQVSMMNKPINHCCSHLVICKDASPFGEFQIGRKQKALAFIAVRYHTEQELGAVSVDRDISPLIEYQKVEAVEFAAEPFQSAVFPGFCQFKHNQKQIVETKQVMDAFKRSGKSMQELMNFLNV
jgi:hypothetical protein